MDDNTTQESSPIVWGELYSRIMKCGACACGHTEAETASPEIIESYETWIRKGYNAGMGYMERYGEVRNDPRLLLEGARSIVSIAYSYRQERHRDPSLPYLATYAYGDDYHDLLRARLRPVSEWLEQSYGARSRICIDSAPIYERYWAVKCGLGEICANGQLYIDGIGSDVFLTEIIIDREIDDTAAIESGNRERAEKTHDRGNHCTGCGACVRVCPGRAILPGGVIDSRRCVNYLTIEHKGEWNDEQRAVMDQAGETLFGCDRCLRVCPLNRSEQDSTATTLPEFRLRKELETLTSAQLAGMTQPEFSTMMKGSPLKRAKLPGLLRNLRKT